MNELERLSIYVPKSLARDLDADARLFEILKSDRRGVNRNRFLSLVVLGHYETFTAERLRLLEVVASQLSGISPSEKERAVVAEQIVRSIMAPVPPGRRIKGAVRLSLKPTRDTEGLISELLSQIGRDDSASRFFYSLLSSYRSLPSYERERVVLKDNYDMLHSACTARERVTFSTTQSPGVIHRVVPFKILAGRDGQLNYLLCYEESNPEWKALSYRLGRISNPRRTGDKGSIPADVMSHLSMMEHYGPQFPINEDADACVRLTDEGARAYQRVYLNRPDCERVERIGDEYLYHFRCSLSQLFLYFRRFGANEAEVLEPVKLRDEIISFHRGALEMYGD